VTLTGATPNEGIVLSSRLFDEPIGVYADTDGMVVIPWSCDPDQAGVPAPITATGSESDRTVELIITGTGDPDGEAPPVADDQPSIAEPDTRADEVVADELRDYLAQYPEALEMIGGSLDCTGIQTLRGGDSGGSANCQQPPDPGSGYDLTPPPYNPTGVSPFPPPVPRCPTAIRPPVGGNERDVLEDRLGEFGNPYIPDERCWSLVATGDSVIAAHNQQSSGIPVNGFPCPGTVNNGNDHRFSFAYRAFAAGSRFSGGAYYNYARTGFTTSQILTARADSSDGCLNEWGRTIRFPDNRRRSPMWHLQSTIDYEHRLGNKVAWLATGGVNNLNWTEVLATFKTCDVLRRAVANVSFRYRPPVVGIVTGDIVTITGAVLVTPTGQRSPTTLNGNANDTAAMAALLEKGGRCQATLTIDTAATRPRPFSTTVTVPELNLRAQRAQITIDVTTMTRQGLQADVDRLVWLGYYDIRPTVFDVRGVVAAFALPAPVVDRIIATLGQAGLPEKLPVASTAQERAVIRDNLNLLSDAVCSGVELVKAQAPAPQGRKLTCLRWFEAGITRADQIQSTVPGGAPHPNAAGHQKLAETILQKL